MNKRWLILALGLWVALMPFLGFPLSWRKPIFILSGLIIAYLAYTSKTKNTAEDSPKEIKTYTQNGQVSNGNEQ